MSSDPEYDALLEEQSQTRSDYGACESRIGECDYLLGRLRPVKTEISTIKSEYEKVKKADDDIYGRKSSWKGNTSQTFHSKMLGVTFENNDYYLHTLDFVLDSINNRITEIENQKLQERGLLGRLGAILNSLANKIENYFN
jgi:hypothetical protein